MSPDRTIAGTTYTPEVGAGSLNFTGLQLEQISSLLGGRMYNMARGFVSPTYVGIELVLKNMPKKSMHILEHVLTGGGTKEGTQAAIDIIDDFFYQGNLSGTFKTYSPRQVFIHKNLLIYALTGQPGEDFDIEKVDLNELAFDFNRTDGTKLSEQESREIIQDIVTNIQNADQEEIAAIYEADNYEQLIGTPQV